LLIAALAASFAFFDKIIEALSRAGVGSNATVRAGVEGYITIHINCPPCVSCIGVVRQFQLLFKGVTLCLSGGRSVPVQLWPGPPGAEETAAILVHQAPDEAPIEETYERWEDAKEGQHWGWNVAWRTQDRWWQSSGEPWQQRTWLSNEDFAGNLEDA